MNCILDCLNNLKKKEKILDEKDNEIKLLIGKIELLKNNIKNLEYELEKIKKKNNNNYEHYSINNSYYRSSDDIEEGYTVFE